MDRILLVEDSPEAVELTRQALSGCGAFELAIAYDGAEAVEYLSATGKYSGAGAPRRPDLVLLDIRIPRLDGFEVLRRIRAGRKTRLVPVVMLTVSGEQAAVDRAYALGANSFLTKPLDYEEYSGMLRQVCSYWLGLNKRPS